jgi:hypothetical protein
MVNIAVFMSKRRGRIAGLLPPKPILFANSLISIDNLAQSDLRALPSRSAQGATTEPLRTKAD